MRILMLVATSLATDTRVLREATTLVEDGHQVHIIGKQVPTDWSPPDGVTASSAGAASVFKADGEPSMTGRRLPPHLRAARWALLPTHRNQAFASWASAAEDDAAGREYDAVHAHDYTALAVGERLARRRNVPLVYDSHEFWQGRPVVGRPTPIQQRRERSLEADLGRRAAAVITVGEGVADALREAYGWEHVHVVRNTFPLPPQDAHLVDQSATPSAALYTGRLAADRELEVIAAASTMVELPIQLMGPADGTWLAGFDPKRAQILPSRPVSEVDRALSEAGLALVTHSDRWENHRLAMPNKLFHAVRVGVPVVATDVGELAALVEQYSLGELYTPGDAPGMAAAIERALAHYERHRACVRAAAPHLTWPSDAEVLRGVYRGLSRSPGR